MKRNLLIISIVLVIMLSALPMLEVDLVASPNAESKQVLEGSQHPSELVNLYNTWDSIYSSTSEVNIRAITKKLSEDYENRVWFPLHKEGSDQLIGAWNYANSTIQSYTAGELHFDFVTEMKNLVAVKEGSKFNSSPIVFAANIAGRYSPGANMWGASVATVLEISRVLHNRDFENDIYYVLINAYRSAYGGAVRGNIGLQNLLKHLNMSNTSPSAIFWFDRLLYQNSEEPMGNSVSILYDGLKGGFSAEEFTVHLAEQISNSAGTISVTGVDDTDSIFWSGSGAEEGWIWGIPSFSFSQYYMDSYSGGEGDHWDVSVYDYSQAKEAAGVAACLAITIGNMGNGQEQVFSGSNTYAADQVRKYVMPITSSSQLNVTLTWETNATLGVEIIDPDDYSVYSTMMEDGQIEIGYMPEQKGVYNIRVENMSNESIVVTYSLSHWQDYDQDALNDFEEFLFDTNSISEDTDNDLLSDYLEREYGTDPRNEDTDSDGARDGIEHLAGSNPLIQDTDSDGILDGLEIELGLNPASNDSDHDNITDDVELENGWNPLSNDTDSDGVLDSIELAIGTNLTLPDTDSDGLGDLFELLNGLDPLSADTDSDGLSDSYEIEHCLMPTDPDTDKDGIPDAYDWAPRDHWISTAPIVGLSIFIIGVIVVLLRKRREYLQGEKRT